MCQTISYQLLKIWVVFFRFGNQITPNVIFQHKLIQIYNTLLSLPKQSKMTSNNIDENSLLRYISFCFEIWGINYISKDVFKKAKENSLEVSRIITRLLFDLTILQILDYQYTIDSLGIKIDDQTQFLEEFVLAYLSQANCPFLITGNQKQQCHTLDFKQSRILLIIAGWLMAKTEFFNKIKLKLIPKLFSELYVQKKALKNKSKNVYKLQMNKTNAMTNYDGMDSDIQVVQRMYKDLSQFEYHIECLQQKKLKICSKLNKKIQQYNKANQTSIKIQNILIEENNNEDDLTQRQQHLLAILNESIRGVKNQQYFWMWIQYKIIEPEFKSLQAEFQDEFERVEPAPTKQWTKLNSQYLTRYDKEYKIIQYKIQQLNQYMSSISSILNAKVPKDAASIRKQVFHEAERMLNEESEEMVVELGIPCFLKLEVRKYCQKKGFGAKNNKIKRRNEPAAKQSGIEREQLTMKIQQFVQNLDQIKFL